MSLTMRCILCFFLFMFAQDLITIQMNSTLGSYLSYIDEFFILGSIGIIVVKSNFRIRKSTLILLLVTIGVLFFGLLSSAINQVPISTTLAGGLLTIKGFLLFFIFKNLTMNENNIRHLIRFFKVLGGLAAVFALVDLLFHEQFRNHLHTNNLVDARSNLVSVQSFFIHPGTYGWFMVFVGLYYLSHYLVHKQKKSLIYMIVFFILAFLSLRFKVLLAIAVILALVAMKKRIYTAALACVGIIIYLFFGDMINNLTMLTIDRYISVDYMDSARKALYHTGFTIGLHDFPLGEGFGRFGSWIARVDYSPVYYEYGLQSVYGLSPDDPKWATDTYWPSIIGEVGILGTILFISFFIYVMRGIYVKLHDAGVSKNGKVFLLFSLFIMIQSLVESLGEQIFNGSPQYIFIFAVMGMAASQVEQGVHIRSSQASVQLYAKRKYSYDSSTV
ncbi:hypothetical protein [Paenibacillus plantarum]|uniref:hypothetical protein n=1 Tax=Paenibacillus plantarum TaxID=2654975 RepID=UPI0014914E36|nr:hypothetical protein [Paenibacillus plantarum]